MQHVHIYSAFQLVLVDNYMASKPPYKPRVSYKPEQNKAKEAEEAEEWREKALEKLSLCRISRIESLMFQFDDSQQKTLLAVVPSDKTQFKATRISVSATPDELQLNKQTVRHTIGLRWFERIHQAITDTSCLAEYGEVYHDHVSFRGVSAKRLIRQARFEVMATRKTGFDDINKALYLANDTYDRKSVLSGREDDTEDMLDAFRDLKSVHTDPLIAELDLTIQLFRRAGLCPSITITK